METKVKDNKAQGFYARCGAIVVFFVGTRKENDLTISGNGPSNFVFGTYQKRKRKETDYLNIEY